jgi:uncharacterized protein YvpB
MSTDRLTGRPLTPIAPAPAPKAPEAPTLKAPEPAAPQAPALKQDQGAVAGGGARSRMALPGSPAKAPQGPMPRDVRDFGKYLEDQGDTNGCGTTSLAMMLSYWKGEPKAYTREKIDEKIRTGPDAMAFSSPDNLEGYAKDQGFRSNAISGGSMDQLKGYLDKGVPVQVLYDPNNDGGDTLLHYVNVVGYTGKGDDIDQLTIADPATGETSNVDREEFEARWNDLELGGVGSGLNNVMIVTLPGENTPIRDRQGNVVMSDDIALPEGGTGFSGAVADLISDATNVVSNGVETVKDGVETVKDTAKDVWNKIF